MEEIKFNVISLEKAKNKTGCAVANITFIGCPKVYTYVRAISHPANDYDFIIIDGCKISFHADKDDELVINKVERVYDTAGKKKTKTSKKHQNDQDSIIESIKEETKVNDDNGQEIESDASDNGKEEIIIDDNNDVHHEEYETIKQCLLANVPVYLAGPAGSGKNFTVEQIAWDLGWNFYFSNSVQQEYKLTGFIDAGGKFHDTEFYKACTDEKDCIFFLDEMDASIPEVLVLLNAAIANGYFEFPTGKVTLNHVHFVAAGNTVGSGSDELYTGRMVLDQATLDRFVIINFDYSFKVELKIAKGNVDLVNFVHKLRDAAKAQGIRATFSYRCIKDTVSLEGKLDLEKIIKIAVVKGMDNDTLRTLNIDCANKYGNAYKKVQSMAK